MSLIYFHRFLILCSILFNFYLAWHLFKLWKKTEEPKFLMGTIGACVVAVAFSIYLPRVKSRLPRNQRPSEKR